MKSLIVLIFAASLQAQTPLLSGPTPTSSGGGTCPSTPVNSIQFNNGGPCGGITGSTWDGTTLTFAGNGTPGNTIAHFGPGSVGNNTFEFFATNDFLNNSAGFLVNSSNNDAAAGSGTGFFSAFTSANPTGTMGTVQAGQFSLAIDGPGALTTGNVLHLGFSASGAGAYTTARGLLIDDIAGAVTNNISIQTGAGDIVLGTLTGTGAATGKTIVCADTNGKLYRSSSGVACAN